MNDKTAQKTAPLDSSLREINSPLAYAVAVVLFVAVMYLGPLGQESERTDWVCYDNGGCVEDPSPDGISSGVGHTGVIPAKETP